MAEKSLREIDLGELVRQGGFYPSPTAWEDQVLYFLLVDRFSDGREQSYRDNGGNVVAGGTTPPFQEADKGSAARIPADEQAWRDAGVRFCGGTLKGLESKVGYLKRLGVTAVWVSPILKQLKSQQTYHGYGIQDYLDVDPRFGTRDDLKRLVKTAHDNGIRVILDIIFNHSGDVFAYEPDRYWTDDGQGRRFFDPRWDGQPYKVAGFRDAAGNPTLPFGGAIDLATHPQAWPDGAVWPVELQAAGTYTCKGRINNWDYDPEYREGDFFSLKDVHHGDGPIDNYKPSPALRALCEVYKFWMAFADLDGYRIDTVKHMDPGATRYVASVLHEFAQRLGKESFYLIGEITGGRDLAYTILEDTGLDAALGVDDIPGRLERMMKGRANPEEYFGLFRNSLLIDKGSHTWFRNKVVTVIDDHDQVNKGDKKARFCADGSPASLALAALALNATTIGIPCVYYGTEQLFDGRWIEGRDPPHNEDRYIREAMFGGAFGAFRSKERHFFSEDAWVYKEVAKILEIRRDKLALRRGRQYLRDISGDGVNYGPPRMIGGEIRSVIPWSRIFDRDEILCAVNTDRAAARSAWVIVDAEIQAGRKRMTCLYSTDPQQVGKTVEIKSRGDGAMIVSIEIPAAGFAMFQ